MNVTLWLNISTFQQLTYPPPKLFTTVTTADKFIHLLPSAAACRGRSATVSGALLDMDIVQQYCPVISLLRACVVEVTGSTLGRAISISDTRVRFLGIAKLNRAQFLEINHDRFLVNIPHLI